MKTLYISNCTEFEAGWGQRPDGFVMSDDREAMLIFIKTKGDSGSHEYFWRYDEPKEVHCDDEQYEEIIAKLNEDGVAHFINADKKELNLFEQL